MKQEDEIGVDLKFLHSDDADWIMEMTDFEKEKEMKEEDKGKPDEVNLM